jgi:hypothetical protein
MAAVANHDSKEIKEGIVRIHRMLELRKLHLRRLKAGKACGICESFCNDKGLQ